MSLSDPTKKMSKSESDIGTIYLLDDEKTIRNKIRKAITDSEFKIYFDPEKKPGISNLLTIMSCLSGKPILELENFYRTETNYGKFKNDSADIVCAELMPLQKKIFNIIKSGKAAKVLKAGAERANSIANKKVDFIYKQIGLR